MYGCYGADILHFWAGRGYTWPVYRTGMKKHVTIAVVNYNGIGYLEGCLKSLEAQTNVSPGIIFLDNASSDGSADYVRKHFPSVTVVANDKNIGYAAAANMGIRMAEGDYVMVMNPDVLLAEDYLEKCVRRMEEDKKIAAITGKLLKYDFKQGKKTNVIDTVGLYCFRNRRVIDEGQGMEDEGQYQTPREVFGVSGACPLYRKEALEDCKIALGGSGGKVGKNGREEGAGEYLDEDFFMYKEDVDLSWRLRLYGWKCFYLPEAVGWHGRGTGVLKRFTHREVLRNRSRLSRFQKYHSYRNQRLMQVKNELIQGFVHDFFPIIWKEILIKGYIIFREPYLIGAMFRFMAGIPRALKKRRIIMKRRRTGWKEMERWLGGLPLKQ